MAEQGLSAESMVVERSFMSFIRCKAAHITPIFMLAQYPLHQKTGEKRARILTASGLGSDQK
jgi:hypothetical protein